MEEVGNDLSATAGELVLESAPQMATELAAEEQATAQPVVDGENAGAGVADGVGTAPVSSEENYPSVEELVAKARAPVKREYVIFNTGPRVMAKSIVIANTPQGGAGNAAETSNVVAAKTSSERKSKRQLKRERQEARSNKSAENICGAVAKTGDMKACKFGDSCRFNHDLTAFMEQKPKDLEGTCPFSDVTTVCPYGFACRYSGSHPEVKGAEVAEVLKDGNYDGKNPMSSIRELNSLNKSFQKLLWKNAVTFPRADAQLEKLGLMGKARKLVVKPSAVEKGDDGVSGPVSNGTTTKVESESAKLDGTAMKEAELIPTLESKNGSSELPGNNEGTIAGTEGLLPSVTSAIDEEFPPHKKVRITVDAGEAVQEAPDSAPKTTNKLGAPRADDEDLKYINDEVKEPLREKKLVDFRGKLYLAPLTTVGNLPFRRVCKRLGADITVGEMAMCTNLLQGQASEWALLRRHEEEDIYGVQICGSYADTVARAAELIERECTIDFIDLNVGCPIDVVVNKGGGSSLLTKPQRLQEIVRATSASINTPLTLKLRMGFFEGRNVAHSLLPNLGSWGATAVTIHGRTRQQRYSKLADWGYIDQCVTDGPSDVQLIGNGDVFSYTEYNEHLKSSGSKLATCMIARGALIKPWLFTEIKEQRHWDITAEERLNILRDYVRFGLIHWGSDSKGVETTRHFLLEWLSYAHRYIPVGLLDVIPQKLNWRPPNYYGRNDLETLMASDSGADWVRLTEMLLGPPPAGFAFSPKHKSNAYDKAENG
ncbi:hypothetical protein M758_4G192300 [Ceratodon purpureus]|uniref:tRNA-dihydrouridine(47) synthase [NAD(P)(+)] n=1 Tax=Ceratodon purpureus TaxID=3225 RepID=A0A8T0IDU8_CERPU|nr:hypothetical protein KC19_N027100 [Ceratodon purpureus]KAG0580648.1 hypothetical protein KC19_4G189300 [Ceratodon purpureus]KAG0620139.1 hypothetical protein M758_4G192300 [Ceratodon purpureus]